MDFLEKVKKFLSENSIYNKSKEFILKFVKENKILSMVIGALLGFLIIFLITFAAVSHPSVKQSDSSETEPVTEFTLPHEYEMPSDDVENTYYYSREKRENWTPEESAEWYTDPSDEKLLNQLEQKNTKKVFGILEAAP